MARRLAFLLPLGAALALLALSHVFFFRWDKSRPDVSAYWEAGEHVRRAEPLYAAEPVPALRKAYLYPPAFAAAFAPLTLLTPLYGHALWMALHFAFLGALLVGTARACAMDEACRLRCWALYAVCLLVPIAADLEEGQTNLLVVACVAGGLALAEAGRDRVAGLLLAAAVHVKVLPIVLLAVLLVQGRRRAAAWMAAGLAALVLLPALWTVPRLGAVGGLRLSFEWHAEFVRRVLLPGFLEGTVAGAEQLYAVNASLRAVLLRLFADAAFTPFDGSPHGPLLFALPRTALTAAATLLGAALVAAGLVLARRAAADPAGRTAGAGLTLAAAQLASVTCWEHHLVSLALLLAPLSVRWGGPNERNLLALTWLPLAVILTAPYAMELANLARGAEAQGYVVATRAWGLPTMAALWLWASVVAAFRRGVAVSGA